MVISCKFGIAVFCALPCHQFYTRETSNGHFENLYTLFRTPSVYLNGKVDNKEMTNGASRTMQGKIQTPT